MWAPSSALGSWVPAGLAAAGPALAARVGLQGRRPGPPQGQTSKPGMRPWKHGQRVEKEKPELTQSTVRTPFPEAQTINKDLQG